MPNLNDIKNEFIREEIDQFIELPNEKSHMISIFSAVNPELLIRKFWNLIKIQESIY